MNILLLTPQLPYPAHQGTTIRNWGILRHLAQNHTVTLVSFAPVDSKHAAPELEAACRAIECIPAPARSNVERLRTLLAGRADLAERLASTQFENCLQRVLVASRYDLVQVEGLELGRYIARIRAAAPLTPIVYDAHNAEITIQRRAWQSDRLIPGRWPAAVYSLIQMPRLARFEAAVCRQASAVTCVSDIDGSELRTLLPNLQPVTIANGIELAEYEVHPAAQPGPPTLIFTGKMDYRPNVDAARWFAFEILPLIRERRPDASFEVVGQKPPPAIARLDGQGGVKVLGAVPDIRPYIAQGAVYVAPLRMGGGTRFKLLEAMALGRPVVSTTIGLEGFAARAGRDLLVADKPDDFARAVLQVLDDPTLASRLGRAGRAFVEAGYDWDTIMPRLEALYVRLAANTSPLAV